MKITLARINREIYPSLDSPGCFTSSNGGDVYSRPPSVADAVERCLG